MKRIITFILMLIMISSVCVAAVPFEDLMIPDLDRNGKHKKDKDGNLMYVYHEATREILQAKGIGLIQGYKDGTFGPDDTVKNGEFIKMAMTLATNRSFDFSIMPECGVSNTDYAPYVSAAEMQNVVPKGKYTDENITEPITRIEMICILSRIQINMKDIPQYREVNMNVYTDIDEIKDITEKELVIHARRYELIEGMIEAKEIKPNENLTRAEAAVALMRIY